MRMTVDPAGPWRLYSPIIPEGAEALGTVTREGYDSGALVRLKSGQLVQVNAGVVRTLPPGPIPVAPESAQSVGADLLLHPIDVGFNVKLQDMDIAVPAHATCADVEGADGGHVLLVSHSQQCLIEELRRLGYRAVREAKARGLGR